MMSNYHVPVMLKECIDGLSIKPGGVYVDVTYGGGGHSKAVLNQLDEKGTLLAFDQDADAVKNVMDDKRLFMCEANFKYLENFCAYYGVGQLDGLLADLGVSSHHLNDAERGFSFRFEDAPLDMRMNQALASSASKVLNGYAHPQLAKVLRSYGDLNKASAMATAIVNYRGVKPYELSSDLETALDGFYAERNKNSVLARVYQAIRIEVNQEMQALEIMLTQATQLLKPGGRLVVMSYHSLEDRMVKNLIQVGNVSGERIADEFGRVEKVYRAITKKPVVAATEEIKRNPRARSAKLRIAEKI
jgi:16S rRNA (cytosine1402-N4)-methyltransferase